MTPLNPTPNSLQYGGDVFNTASSFLRRVVPGVAVEGGPPRVALAKGARATAALLAGLPTLTVHLSDSPAGERLREHFGHRQWGIRHSRLAQGVLVLPETHAGYLRGRSRQALRTNMRKARDAGISCRPMVHLSERRAAALDLRARTGMARWPDESLCRPGDVWWLAHDRRGEGVALAQLTVDREWALLQSLVSTQRPSRYLLHSEVVAALIAADVQYLAVNTSTAPLLHPSLQYWQRLLGFYVANLSVRRESVRATRDRPPATVAPRVEPDARAGGQEGPVEVVPVPASLSQ
jgi:hypothetical protein